MKTSGISEVEIALNEACVGEVGVKPGETREQKTVYLNAEKEQSPDANAEFKDSELRGLRNKKCYLEEGKKNLKDKCDTLRAVKAKKEVEFKLLKKNVDILVEIYEQRKMAAEEKLKTKQCEPVERENQLSASEKQWKLVSEEAHKYKQQIEQMKEQLQQEEYIFRHQIALHEKKAQDNWIENNGGCKRNTGCRNRCWEDLRGSPAKDSESDAAHVRNSSSFPTEDVKKDQFYLGVIVCFLEDRRILPLECT
ncbi:transport and Golgi organization protein 1 homolog [Hippopotamus amphibius kiboko]|uniref:transport and Golgi organization protein 1 homolog n=1 Tax=Hippopotamus amphibius kiboko TaxID=575201 RepID=UPI002594077E|nr:transport and Golgi organization protein 1 homolog [Hippopotamus amphibius kiboko]